MTITSHVPKHNQRPLGKYAVRIAGIAVTIGVATGMVVHFSDRDSHVPATPTRQELASSAHPFVLQSPVIISVPDAALAAELATQFAQDDSASSGTAPVTYAIGSAALDDEDLNQINQIRASFGEAPLVVLTVTRLAAPLTTASAGTTALDEATLNELNGMRMSFGAPALDGVN